MRFKALLSLQDSLTEEIRPILLEEEFEVFSQYDRSSLLEDVSSGSLDIIFLESSCSSGDSRIISDIKKIKKLDPRVEIICLGMRKDDEMTIEIIKCGATACLGILSDKTVIRGIAQRVKEHAHHRREIYEIETILHKKYTFAGMVSKNPVMLDIFSLIRRVAPYFSTMLITGDTGTGKEILARAVHDLSNARGAPFIACNCSSLTENLIESELFGHTRGAFTGAIHDKKGLFEAAGDGTIFLDEIGHMPVNFQPHLLRVLQDGEFRRVGSTKTMRASCRVIAATNANLKELIEKGLFREDLYYRLAVITIKLPALIERKEDIPLLSQFLLNRFRKKIGKNVAGISLPTKGFLMSYDWPGNVRELENVLESAFLVTNANFIRPEDLPSCINELKSDDEQSLEIDDLIKNHIQRVLLTTGNNKTRAASLLGISRRALQRKIEKYSL